MHSNYGNKPLLIKFWIYLKKPFLEVGESIPWYIKLFNIVRLWSLTFTLALMFGFLSTYLLDTVGYDEGDFAIRELFDDLTPLAIIFALVIWAPVFEEVTFRLGLRFSPIKWGVSLTMLISFAILLFNIPFLGGYFFEFDSWQGLLITLLVLFLASLFFAVIFSLKAVKSRVYSFFKNNFAYFYYVLALIFAFIHITNYQEDWYSLLHLSPILVMPQILLSFVISFVRMHYGFLWAVILHALNNGAIAAVLLLFLPVMFLEDVGQLEAQEIMKYLSPSEIFTVSFGTFFLMGLMLLILLSIISLWIEIFKFKNRSS